MKISEVAFKNKKLASKSFSPAFLMRFTGMKRCLTVRLTWKSRLFCRFDT